MKIIVRIPTEAYAYHEVEFENLTEYRETYPEFVKQYYLTRFEVQKITKQSEVPFK